MYTYLENMSGKFFKTATSQFRITVVNVKIQIVPVSQFDLETYSNVVLFGCFWHIDNKTSENKTIHINNCKIKLII